MSDEIGLRTQSDTKGLTPATDRFVVYTTNEPQGRGRNESLPTFEAYGAAQYAFDRFNGKLFGGRLPNPMFTLFNARARGHFCARCYAHVGDPSRRVDEIMINPRLFQGGCASVGLSTLLHEMCHMDQAHFGKPSPWGYHNVEWAEAMESRGLRPTHNGAPDGNRTGRKMTHLIIPGGPFDLAARELVSSGFTWSWGYAQPTAAGDNSTKSRKSKGGGKGAGVGGVRVKYSCGSCYANAWARPALPLICGRCSMTMMPGALK